MGRVLKRVPVDFAWPIRVTWQGYVAPTIRSCPSPDCDNGGTVALGYLANLTSLILLLGENAHARRLHPWIEGLPIGSRKVPAEDAIELTTGLAGRPPGFGGYHDAIDRNNATRKIIAAAGLPDDWGLCPICAGHAIHPDDLAISRTWEATEPPAGDGYQLWEAGEMPITPVFATLRDLSVHAAAHCTTFGSSRATADEWEQMLEGGLVAVVETMPDGTKAMFL